MQILTILELFLLYKQIKEKTVWHFLVLDY